MKDLNNLVEEFDNSSKKNKEEVDVEQEHTLSLPNYLRIQTRRNRMSRGLRKTCKWL